MTEARGIITSDPDPRLKPAEAHVRLLATLLEHNAQPTLVFGPDLGILAVNRRAADVLGRGVDWLVGSALDTILSEEGVDCAIAWIRGPLDGGAASSREWRVRRSDRDDAVLSCTPARLEGFDGHVLVTIDEWRTERTGSHPHQPGEVSYDVSLLPSERGRILRVFYGSVGDSASRPGSTCFELIAGRTEPCVGCVVFSGKRMPASDQEPSVHVSSQGHASIVTGVSALDAGVARVHRRVVDERTFTALAMERVNRLAERGRLTPRERVVLHHLVGGSVPDEIGSALAIAPRTIRFHQANIFAKLGVDSRGDLLRVLL